MEKFTKAQKIVISIIIFLLVILAILVYIFYGKNENQINIYAAIGGAVKNPKVYNVTGIKQLYELVLLAGGLKSNADVSKIDLEKRIEPFKLYCIPYKKAKAKNNIIESIPQKRTNIQIPKTKNTTEINIIYAGLPRTYLLITIIPEKNLLLVTHIPYYTLIPNSYYNATLYETYLTGGVLFLLNSTYRIVGKKIDYYFTQNREQWIKFIDLLEGIEVNLPEDFRKDYHIDQKKYKLNGVLSWEYIRYMNKMYRKTEITVGTFNRMSNQKQFVKAMFKKFKENNFFKQGNTLKLLLSTAETNLKVKDLINIFFKFKDVNHIKLELLTLPGAIKEIDGKDVWITQQDFYDKEIKDIIKNYD